jgi:EmrB/QacA subfamily drug resistance transporter
MQFSQHFWAFFGILILILLCNMKEGIMKMNLRSKERYPWFVLSVTSLGVLLVLLNAGSLNVALPVVSQHFHAGAIASNWILLSYMLVNTILILVFGQFADIFGRRKLYLIGLVVFTLASFLVGFSPNIPILILLRAVQAIGGALLITNTTALITDAFPAHQLGSGLGINVLVASCAQLLGPVLGGLMASVFGWRWVFWFNVPLGLIGFVWAYLILRDNPLSKTGEKIDLLGGIVVFVALGGLISSLSEGSILGWSNWIVIAGFGLFIILTPVFIFVEKKCASPMIDFSMFQKRPFTMANVATFLNSFSMTAVILLIALFYQVAHKENPFEAGFKVLPVTIGMIVISPIAGSLTRKYSTRLLSSTGLAISASGFFILTWTLGPQTPYWIEGFGMLLVGVGSGLFLTPNTTTIMTGVPQNRRGIANGVRSMLNNMGQVLSTALVLMIVTASLPARLKAVIFAGSSVSLSAPDLNAIVIGYRYALITLMVATLIGMFASLLRGSGD